MSARRSLALSALRTVVPSHRIGAARALSANASGSSPIGPSSTSTANGGPDPDSSSGASSSYSSGSSGKPNASSRAKYLWLSLLPVGGYYLWPLVQGRKALSPQIYSEQPVSGNAKLSTGRHVLLTLPVADADAPQFREAAVSLTGATVGDDPDVVVVQHVMARNPTLMIERPFTPVNDTRADGEMRIVVKRVRGGEVGRLIHSLQPSDTLGVRGPITTFALNPSAFDTIVMISTGTAVAPFLQLLAKAQPSTGPTSTKYRLLQAKPVRGDDWSAEFIAPLKEKWGDSLEVNRIEPGMVRQEDVAAALQGSGRVLVLVCMPPNIMRPLCGTLTPTLQQGPLTGLLAHMGLRSNQVWKLE